MKIMVVAVILLFVGICILPNVGGTVVKYSSTDPRNDTSRVYVQGLLLGLIKNTVKVTDNYYEFHVNFMFVLITYKAQYLNHGIIINEDTNMDFDEKIGFIGKHVICGIFMWEVY